MNIQQIRKKVDLHSMVYKACCHPFNLFNFCKEIKQFESFYDHDEILFSLQLTKWEVKEMVWQILDDILIEYRNKPVFQKKKLIKFIQRVWNWIDIDLDYFD